MPGGQADIGRVRRMAGVLSHRGPDQTGSIVSPDGQLAIGFQRLSIIDPAGSAQPMSDPQKSHILAYNGEIYNYRELRRQLPGPLRTQGDTEVLLELLAREGLGACEKLNGMFACAWYDTPRATLTLLRDRLGQKPLWYTCRQGRWFFASEAKALREGCPDLSMDEVAITCYTTMGYIPAPRSAFQGVSKLEPGCALELSASSTRARRYWKLSRPGEPAPVDPGRIRRLLAEATRKRLVADTTLGVLLSGGIDSAITALLAKEVLGELRTFAAGFDSATYDERPLARQTAELLGTNHVELRIAPPGRDEVERIVDHFDEPFADSSALPMWLLCQATREHVKVALTGDGGDEAFGGYDRYRAMHLGQTMGPAAYMLIQVAGGILGPFAPRSERNRLRRLVRLAKGLSHPPAMQYFSYRSLFDEEDLGRLFSSEWAREHESGDAADWFSELYAGLEGDNEFQHAQMHDVATYLPDDLLVKADMASMAHGLELRSPFLDHEVMSAGVFLPVSAKLANRRGKAILRRIFGRELPADVISARKRGFGVPLADWLRGDLRGMVEEVILDRSFLNRGIFHPEAIVGLWNDHLSRRQDYQHRIWMLFVLARWLNRQD